jgi:MFS family permease
MERIARLPHFAGVILACGCLIGVLGFGPRSGMGFLLTPMSSAHSWGRDVFALALAIQMLVWGAAQPFAGAMADRFGAAPVLSVGAVLSRSASPRWPMPERRRCSTSVPA